MNPSEITNKLTPCGCGGLPEIVSRMDGREWYIKCPTCGMRTAAGRGHPTQPVDQQELQALSTMAKIWNTAMRPRPTEIPPLAKAILAAAAAFKTYLREP